MSQLEVDKIIPQSGTTLTIGDSGDTITFADGAVIGIDTNTLYIDSANNRVGIGTSSPSRELEIASSSTQIRLTDTDTNAYAEIGTDGSGILNFMADEGNTGASPRITFDVSTTERMRIDSSGNVGIGTSSPKRSLQIGDNTDSLEILSIQSTTSGSSRIYFGSNDGTNAEYSGYLWYDHSNDSLRIATDSTERMRIASNGRVGIGTSSPERLLHLQSSAPEIMMKDSDDSSYNTILSNGGTLSFSTGSTEAMRIDSSGNVGIGESNPDTRLYINSGTANTNTRFVSTDTAVLIQFKDDTGSSQISSVGGDFRFGTSGDSSFAGISEAMRIDSSGNVGIGTSSPDAILHIVSESVNPLLQRTTLVGNNSTFASFSFKNNDTIATSITNINKSGSAKNSGADGYEFRFQNNGNGYTSFFNDGSESLRIDSSGNLLVGRTNNPSGVSNCIYALGNYGITTGSGANVFINSEGLFFRSTSSLKYKNTIQDSTNGLTELLTLRPVTYKGNNDGNKIFGGLIAEEVHEAGLTEFVEYDDEGNPDALHYGNMVSLCIKAIQELKADNDALRTRIETLENA